MDKLKEEAKGGRRGMSKWRDKLDAIKTSNVWSRCKMSI